MKYKKSRPRMSGCEISIEQKTIIVKVPIKSFTKLTQIQSFIALIAALLNIIAEIEAYLIREGYIASDKYSKYSHNSLYFKSYRERVFQTIFGKIKIRIPRFRKAPFTPFFIKLLDEETLRLHDFIIQAYVAGISTRGLSRLLKNLGLPSVVSSTISKYTKPILDEVMNVFQNNPIKDDILVLWFDAQYQYIRIAGTCQKLAILTVIGLTAAGERVVLSVEVRPGETEASYSQIIDGLIKRGLNASRVALVISDAHKGIRSAIASRLPGVSWQRCTVHFMRNLTEYARKDLGLSQYKTSSQFKEICQALSLIWKQESYEEALDYARQLMETYQDTFPQAMNCLRNGLDDSLTFYKFAGIDRKFFSSNNLIELFNRCVRIRTKTIGSFCDIASARRLIIGRVVYQMQAWLNETYIDPAALKLLVKQSRDYKQALNEEMNIGLDFSQGRQKLYEDQLCLNSQNPIKYVYVAQRACKTLLNGLNMQLPFFISTGLDQTGHQKSLNIQWATQSTGSVIDYCRRLKKIYGSEPEVIMTSGLSDEDIQKLCRLYPHSTVQISLVDFVDKIELYLPKKFYKTHKTELDNLFTQLKKADSLYVFDHMVEDLKTIFKEQVTQAYDYVEEHVSYVNACFSIAGGDKRRLSKCSLLDTIVDELKEQLTDDNGYICARGLKAASYEKLQQIQQEKDERNNRYVAFSAK